MPVPIVFRSANEELITYNFLDRILGAQAVLYLSRSSQSTGDESVLAGTATDSDPEYQEHTGLSTSFVLKDDFDFDIVVEKSATIEGEGVFNFLLGASDLGGAPNSEIYLIIKIRKWDGSTETDIATVQSDTMSNGDGLGTFEYKRNQCQVTIPKTTLKKGEFLRISVAAWARAGNGGSKVRWFHDTTHIDTLSTGVNTDFTSIIPVTSLQQ